MTKSTTPSTLQFQTIKLQIGDYEVLPIPTGMFGLDGGAMFGTVPKVLWEQQIPADAKNRIPMEARALLLKSKGRKILIDTGNGSDFKAKYGDKLGEKFTEMYNMDESGPNLLTSLARFGVKPEEITDVILTHLHFDHAGGATCADSQGQIVPRFPKAQYYVQKANLEAATTPNIREKASYFSVNFQALLQMDCLKLLNGDQENILPGISVYVSNGHTRGQQVIRVHSQDNKQNLLYCGDLVPTSAHVRLAWVMGYDLDPLTLIGEKEKYLGRAADEAWHLYFEHDPYTEVCRIERKGTDFAVKERFHI